MNKKIFALIFVFSAIIFGIVVYLIIDFNNTGTESGEIPVVQNITISCSDLTLRIDEGAKQLNYQINNPSNLDYTKEMYATGNGISLDGDNVIPHRTGTWYVSIIVRFGNDTATKVVSVYVQNPQFSATLEILDNNFSAVDNLFYTNSYKLKVNISKNVNYELSATSEIQNLVEISRENNEILYTFDVVKPSGVILLKNAEAKFTLSYYGLNFYATKKIYQYTTSINLKFSRSGKTINLLSDDINLHCFNTVYRNEAQTNGYYDSISYTVPINASTLNSYDFEITDTNVAMLENNTITAKSAGICNFRIIAKDGSNYVKTYKIIVKNVVILQLETSNDISLNLGEEHTISYTFSPIYAITNFEVYVDGNKTENMKISYNCAQNHTVLIKDTISKKEVSYNITVVDYVFETVILESFLQTYGATYNQGVLAIQTEEDFDVPLSYQISPSDLLTDIECDIEFVNVDGLTLSVVYYESNAIIISVSGKGNASVCLTSKENTNITCTFNIVVL